MVYTRKIRLTQLCHSGVRKIYLAQLPDYLITSISFLEGKGRHAGELTSVLVTGLQAHLFSCCALSHILVCKQQSEPFNKNIIWLKIFMISSEPWIFHPALTSSMVIRFNTQWLLLEWHSLPILSTQRYFTSHLNVTLYYLHKQLNITNPQPQSICSALWTIMCNRFCKR